MFCPKCGAENADDARTCSECGAELPSIARAQGGRTRPLDDRTRPIAGPEGRTSLIDDGMTDVVDRPARGSNETVAAPRPAATSYLSAARTERLDDVDDDGSDEAQATLDRDLAETYVIPAATPQQRTSRPPSPERPPLEGNGDPTGAKAEEGPKGRGKAAAALVAVVVALAVLGGVAFATYRAGVWGGAVVPDVVGQNGDSAKAQLQQAGFDVTVEGSPQDSPTQLVLAEDPAAGTRVAAHASVTLTVSVARTIPKVTGLSLADAQKALSDAGATNVQVAHATSNEPADTVLSVDPGEGQAFGSTDPVTLTVSQASTVPDVVGKSQDDATAALKAAGYEAKAEWKESDQDAYTVLSTDPTAGTTLGAGSTVTLTVSAPGARSELYLADYLGASPRSDSAYLSWKGWALSYGFDYGGYAEESWTKSDVGELVFTRSPESHHHGKDLNSGDSSDVMASGSKAEGVRLEAKASGAFANPSCDEACVVRCLAACGLSNPTLDSYCDQASYSGPGTSSSGHRFACGTTKVDGYVWAVSVISANGQTSVAVLCAPSAHFDGAGSSLSGLSLAERLAYYDNFTE
jgi:serine/threonine-protein kinase